MRLFPFSPTPRQSPQIGMQCAGFTFIPVTARGDFDSSLARLICAIRLFKTDGAPPKLCEGPSHTLSFGLEQSRESEPARCQTLDRDTMADRKAWSRSCPHYSSCIRCAL